MYHARRNFTLKGFAVKIGDPVDLSGLMRPEALVRGGFVEWHGEGKRDAMHPEAFRADFYGKKPAPKRIRAKKAAAKAVVQPLELGKKVPA